jgi:two-component system, NarL family, sensor histidine kinase UhpB
MHPCHSNIVPPTQPSIEVLLQQTKDHERQGIAAQLHDEVNAHLLGLKMGLARIQDKLHRSQELDKAWLTQELDYLATLAMRSLASTQAIATQLHPPVLALGIVPALEWQSRECSRQFGIRCYFQSTLPEIALSDAQTYAIFFICQEALNNIGQHAKASHAKIQLHADSSGLRLKIRDNGIGLPSQVIPGLGLRSMQVRALSIGASFTQGNNRVGTEWIMHLPANALLEPHIAKADHQPESIPPS